MKNASYYRKQAAEVRRRADEATKDDVRTQYLYIVARYEALAEAADEASKDVSKKLGRE